MMKNFENESVMRVGGGNSVPHITANNKSIYAMSIEELVTVLQTVVSELDCRASTSIRSTLRTSLSLMTVALDLLKP